MQGRLSAPVNGKIQSFPIATWRDEFFAASSCGFELLEWVFAFPDWSRNPLLWQAGRLEIAELQRAFDVEVPLLCGDYFMERPLTSDDVTIRVEALGVLVELVRRAPSIGMHLIELPLIGQATLSTEEAMNAAVTLFRELTPLLESTGVSLLLELDLGPSDVQRLLKRIDSPRVLLNYDLGNSAYWGFNAEEEIPLCGPWIRNVHVKDVTKAQYSVPLGTGEVDFDRSFALLRDASYTGDFILQTARGADDVATARHFGAFTREYVSRYFA